jgi:hypothetical protein
MKLVKLSSGHYIIVDESKQPVEGYYYDEFIRDIRDTRGAEYGQADHCWQITHSTQPLEYVQIYADIKSGWYWGKIKQLSLSEVKELLGELDVEKKVSEHFKNYWTKEDGTEMSSDEITADMMTNMLMETSAYNAGYNQALEDNKGNVYTEEDMKKAMNLYKNTSIPINDIIQSLQPPTSWDVQFVNGKLKLL